MYKIGDVVFINSWTEIKKTLDIGEHFVFDSYKLTGGSIHFVDTMLHHCGTAVTVKGVQLRGFEYYYVFKENNYSWHEKWLVPKIIDNRSVM